MVSLRDFGVAKPLSAIMRMGNEDGRTEMTFGDDYIEVSHDKFWGMIYHHKFNVHPDPKQYETEWKNLNDMSTFARTTHGYLTPGEWHKATPPERFFIARRFAALIESAPERNPKGESK